MKKKEMTKQQLETRTRIVQVLTDAGWQGTAFNDLFDRGKPVNYEASMEYQNQTMSLTLSYEARKDVVHLGIYQTDGDGIDLVIDFGEKLFEVLKIISSFQDDVTAKNYKKLIRSIVIVCPTTYTLVGENEELVQVLLDD